MQGNLANTYEELGRLEAAMRLKRDVYSGYLKLFGKDSERSLLAGNNYTNSLASLRRFEEAKSFLRKTIPVARRVLEDSDPTTLRMRGTYARVLHKDPAATLDDLREATTTLEDTARTARRVLGGAHPLTGVIECHLQQSRAALSARETPPPGDPLGSA